MRCLILLNGRAAEGMTGEEREFYRELAENSDMIICADGGLNAADDFGIEPDIVIGDMDSVRPELLEETEEKKIIRHPMEKDLTDGRLAVQEAVRRGCGEVIISLAVSEETDHTLANIQMLASLPEGVKGCILERNLRIEMIKGAGILHIEGHRGDRVSLLPLSELVEGINLNGLKYGMKEGRFSIGGMNGISNEMVEEEAEVRIKKGMLAVFHYG